MPISAGITPCIKLLDRSKAIIFVKPETPSRDPLNLLVDNVKNSKFGAEFESKEKFGSQSCRSHSLIYKWLSNGRLESKE